MRKIATTAAALILMISLCAGVIAQTSPSSTPVKISPAATKPADELTRDQTIAILIADLKELREVYELTKFERDKAVAALADEKAERQSLERSYTSAEKQIATLNRSIEHLEKAIGLHEKTIAMVEKQRDDAKRDAKRSRKQAVIASAVAALSLLKFFGIF